MTSEAPAQHKDGYPKTAVSRRVDGALHWVGDRIGWVWLLLMVVVVLNVGLRYLFSEGRVELEELQWHLYSFGFLVGLATCFASDDHIRVDVIHERLSPRWRAWIELYGLLLLFFPFVLMLLIYSLPFVQFAWNSGEVSSAPGGLPARWLIKSMLTLSMLLLLAAGFARLTRVSAFLFGVPGPLEDHSLGRREPSDG